MNNLLFLELNLTCVCCLLLPLINMDALNNLSGCDKEQLCIAIIDAQLFFMCKATDLSLGDYYCRVPELPCT